MTIEYLAKEYDKLMTQQAREVEVARQKIKRKYEPKLKKLNKMARELGYR